MNIEYFNMLITEINAIRDYISSGKNRTFSYLKEADGIEYFVILKNGTSFYISVGTNKLPEFNERDIVYIRKKLYSVWKSENRVFIDTEVGEFDLDDQLSHAFEMEKKFNVTDEFLTGCYD